MRYLRPRCGVAGEFAKSSWWLHVAGQGAVGVVSVVAVVVAGVVVELQCPVGRPSTNRPSSIALPFGANLQLVVSHIVA